MTDTELCFFGQAVLNIAFAFEIIRCIRRLSVQSEILRKVVDAINNEEKQP